MEIQYSTCTISTLKSLIEEHARLDFSDFLSTLFAIFHVIPPCSFINLLSKKAGRVIFFSKLAHLFPSARLLGTLEYSFTKAGEREFPQCLPKYNKSVLVQRISQSIHSYLHFNQKLDNSLEKNCVESF